MIIIEHRKNTIEDIKSVQKHNGIEIDIRSQGDRLILQHDPFYKGTDFEEWLEYYDHKLLILNTKEEGLEKKIKILIDKKRITNYFYLDLSFPFLVKLINSGEKNIAVRFSEYESIETCLSLAGKIEWVWVDCFTRFPLNRDNTAVLKEAGFKLCLVSPELQGRTTDEIVRMRRTLFDENIIVDAVCTKMPHMWL